MRRALCWLRRDLRLDDNSALAAATEAAAEVMLAFVFDTRILDSLQDRVDKRVAFIRASVEELDERLRGLGSGLFVLHGDPVREIPALCRRLGIESVFASHDDDPYAVTRDAAVGREVELRTVKDHVVFERQEIVSGAGEPFRVYTPYSKAWLARLTSVDVAERRPDLGRLARPGPLAMPDIGFLPATTWVAPGEEAGRRRLTAFGNKMPEYGKRRDFPAEDATSGLSVHLRFGTVGIRQCVRAARAQDNAGADKWLKELIWRDFYHMVLANFPYVVERPFRAEYADLAWPGGAEAYQAWEDGRTGYPIVDAAMRCLNATGWMHNRLRMVVASFLSKDLLVDYRRGEAHFARRLLDFDLASNNGGWQWAASVGVDAQPYFRIFNPVLQSRKFDPSGAFIREWLPEIADLPDALIHWPHDSPLEVAATGYPAPIVDHLVQRDRAIRLLS